MRTKRIRTKSEWQSLEGTSPILQATSRVILSDKKLAYTTLIYENYGS